jgi:prepilin-type N-terminal cleavage/methylation domain-containing protein
MGHVREGNAERGFTLIELMAVVVILVVLAAVVIPSFMKETNKAKGLSEATAMFAEIAQKQEQFKAEQGKYMGDRTDAAFEGTTTCPASVPSSDYNFATSCMTGTTAWTDLRVDPSSSSLRCQYTIEAGKAGTTLTPPTWAENSLGVTGAAEPALAGAWWSIHAVCDESKNGGTNAEYYKSSVNGKIQKHNEGA